ncbi:3-hydroxyacyl-CoA dehydrogenase NAD-binding domain-containing protein [Kistimonas asteriae]|uniref:3-hydroxyacyl-CoA dehydrogenase NAD-binding domain-containing protein n=1 Tax=Kistimonas asteriae TaxID=517724 RepID=UPI001BACFE7F|nr:3-hydroxyacyl-CoA dehydrogenase NAD-binding domain-containing protein [Kistimonas asteriae]
MTSIRYEKTSDHIVHLVMDRQDGSTNIMDAAFQQDFHAVIDRLEAEKESLAGVILRSAKKTFFAGGDLKALIQVGAEQGDMFFRSVEAMKADMRRLETLGVPVVAAINGTALGGGWELCLMCHHRIALADDSIRLGLPEVTLGLLPGAGGIVRTVRLLGLEAAFPLLMEGKQLRPAAAYQRGLIHTLVETDDQLPGGAEAWIRQHAKSVQPWDEKGYRIPGGAPSTPRMAQKLAIAPAMLKEKTKGCYPAPEAILSAAVEGAQVDFDTATRIESRWFTRMVTGQVSKNMIGTFWFQLNAIKAGGSRPDIAGTESVKKVGILGAGMMGAGIAWACASRGIDVVLKDVSFEQAEKGKAYSTQLLDKRLKRKQATETDKVSMLERIQTTTSAEDLADCDLVIEAVFEDRALKASVTREAEAALTASSVFASNTSTLPISGLAEASVRPANFIGLHFFSPADKMPLVEIIRGQQTSDETLAKAFDFVLQINKTPIVVNDSRGFFTSRVFGTFTNEGIAMLAEGVAPAAIENGALLAGMPVGPLAICDEVSLTLIGRIRNQAIQDLKAEGKTYQDHPADAAVDRMLGLGREGRAAGGGFYDYPDKSQKHLWPALTEYFAPADEDMSLRDIKDRLLFIQALETVRCLEEGVLSSIRDANIGSIFGIGFAAWTGGALQFINQYGIRDFVTRSQALAEQFGERFTPPALLLEQAAKDAPFKDLDSVY